MRLGWTAKQAQDVSILSPQISAGNRIPVVSKSVSYQNSVDPACRCSADYVKHDVRSAQLFQDCIKSRPLYGAKKFLYHTVFVYGERHPSEQNDAEPHLA